MTEKNKHIDLVKLAEHSYLVNVSRLAYGTISGALQYAILECSPYELPWDGKLVQMLKPENSAFGATFLGDSLIYQIALFGEVSDAEILEAVEYLIDILEKFTAKDAEILHGNDQYAGFGIGPRGYFASVFDAAADCAEFEGDDLSGAQRYRSFAEIIKRNDTV